MLVLSLKPGEEAVIGGGSVVVSIQEIRGNKVRIGFVADKKIPIHRRTMQDLIDSGISLESAIAANKSGSEGGCSDD